MTLEEARKFATVITLADYDAHHRCYISDLIDLLNSAFPDFSWGYKPYEPVVVEPSIVSKT